MSTTVIPVPHTRGPDRPGVDRHLRARGAGPLSAAAVFIGRSLRQSLRDGEGLAMAIVLPVLLMLLFTYVFGGAIDGGTGGYVTYVVPGIVLLCAGFGASSVAVAINRDVTTGAMNRFRTMPILSPLVLLGHVVASVLRNMLATAVVVGVGLLVGFEPVAGIGDWLAAAAVVALYVLAITSLFAFIGMIAGSPESANGYGFVLLFLPYTSSAFVPVDTMPDWLQGFAQHQPLTPVIETTRALLTGSGTPQLGAAAAWCLAVILLATVLVAVVFPRRVAR